MTENLTIDPETLSKIKDLLFQKGHDMTYPSDFEEFGIDPETALEYLRIIEYCQNEAPIVSIWSREKNGLDSFFVQTNYGTRLDSILREMRRLSSAESREITSSELSQLMVELKSVITDRTGIESIDIQLPNSIVEVRMECSSCGEELDIPYHCDQAPLQLHAVTEELYCDLCGYRSSVPKHCGEPVLLVYLKEGSILAQIGIKSRRREE